MVMSHHFNGGVRKWLRHGLIAVMKRKSFAVQNMTLHYWPTGIVVSGQDNGGKRQVCEKLFRAASACECVKRVT